MATSANIWFVPDAPDVQRMWKTGGVKSGDMIFEYDNNTLYVVHPSGLQTVSINAATTSAFGAVKQIAHQTQLTSVGTAGAGTVDVGSTFNQTTLNNNFATLTARINALYTQMQNAGQSA